MTRFEDWPVRLDAAVEAARGRPFDWVTHNCATFAADVVEALTGERLHDSFSALHTSAHRAIVNGQQLRAAIEARLADAVPPAFAQRGDVVLLNNAGHDVLGICLDTRAVAVGEAGLGFVPMREAVCAWRV